MEVLTQKATRRSTRIRVEIPLRVTSLDRLRPFAEKCVAVVVSAQGCGFRSPHALPLETPVLLSDLPGGVSTSGRVASCVPLGSDGSFLIGVSLYNHGNVWGIAEPPDDWNESLKRMTPAEAATDEQATAAKGSWPYNMFSGNTEAPLGRK